MKCRPNEPLLDQVSPSGGFGILSKVSMRGKHQHLQSYEAMLEQPRCGLCTGSEFMSLQKHIR